MYLILPVACTLFQSSKMIKFGHRPYSSYEKNMYLITMYSITLYLITAPQCDQRVRQISRIFLSLRYLLPIIYDYRLPFNFKMTRGRNLT